MNADRERCAAESATQISQVLPAGGRVIFLKWRPSLGKVRAGKAYIFLGIHGSYLPGYLKTAQK